MPTSATETEIASAHSQARGTDDLHTNSLVSVRPCYGDRGDAHFQRASRGSYQQRESRIQSGSIFQLEGKAAL